MLRFVSGVMLPVAFGMLCSCNSSSPPSVTPPPLPLVNRIQPADPSKLVVYEDVPWNEWKNPRLIVSSRGTTVLLSGKSEGITVPPQRVGDVLQKTTESDWPLGLVVMVTINGVVGDPQKMEANWAELSIVLNNLGIGVVWGPPSA
jgi:hypothetical protein